MILKNFSKRTIKTYVQIVKQLISLCEEHHLNIPISDDIVRKYLLYRFDQGKHWQTVNSDCSAIQKFFKNVLMLSWSLTKLPRARKEKKLPSILSKEDVVKIIESAATFKQQVLLTFVYVTGARLSETIHVEIEDINSHRMQVRINQGKGNKDRFIILPQKIAKATLAYIALYKFNYWLILGQNGENTQIEYPKRPESRRNKVWCR